MTQRSAQWMLQNMGWADGKPEPEYRILYLYADAYTQDEETGRYFLMDRIRQMQGMERAIEQWKKDYVPPAER